MKIVAEVPLKLNNQRLPGKNTKSLENGKPLVRHILDTLHKVDCIDEIYVYCSDAGIKDFMAENEIYLKRDPQYDLPTCNTVDISKNFCREVDADVYILTQATAPFISAESIKKGIEAITDNGHDSAFSVIKSQEFMWIDGVPNYNLSCLPRQQDMKPAYIESCGFWIYTKSVMLELGRRIGDNPALIEVSKIESTDIDEAVDFEIANAIWNSILKDKA